jgi:hypothetical protein
VVPQTRERSSAGGVHYDHDGRVDLVCVSSDVDVFLARHRSDEISGDAMTFTLPNKMHALDGGNPRLFHIGRHCAAASDAHR